MNMICNCGYEYRDGENDNEEWQVFEGDEKFKESTLTVTYNEKQGDWDRDRLENKIVYICPKCGTLKIDI